LQRDALRTAGVATRRLYEDRASGRLDDRPGLDAALKALRHGDTLVVWKLDRLGRDLRHLINIIHDLSTRGIGCLLDNVHWLRWSASYAPARVSNVKRAISAMMLVCGKLSPSKTDIDQPD
jgi:hypothetical protein